VIGLINYDNEAR